MNFGTVYSFQDPPDSAIGHPRLYAGALEQIALSERQGYTWLNLTEHHVSDDGYGSALLVVLAAAAAITERLRLSTSMLLLPLHQPVRLAEEAAVVDVLSAGRLTLGLSVGYRQVEFEAMGVQYATRGRRFKEALEILQRAWTGEAFTFSGEQFEIPEIVVRPRPVQRPHPPIWIGGVSDPALRRAVRFGSPLVPGGVDSVDDIRRSQDRYRQLGGGGGIVLPRFALVADTTDEARRLALPALTWMFDRYRAWGAPAELQRVLEDWRSLDDVVIVGDEDHCRASLERYTELGVTDMMMQFALPTLEPSVAADSQARFAHLLPEYVDR